MITVYSEKHRLRDAKTELSGGEFITPMETPARAETILASVRAADLGEVIEPTSHSLDSVLKLHDSGYIHFLETAWREWVEDGNSGKPLRSPGRGEAISTGSPRPLSASSVITHMRQRPRSPRVPGRRQGPPLMWP